MTRPTSRPSSQKGVNGGLMNIYVDTNVIIRIRILAGHTRTINAYISIVYYTRNSEAIRFGT